MQSFPETIKLSNSGQKNHAQWQIFTFIICFKFTMESQESLLENPSFSEPSFPKFQKIKPSWTFLFIRYSSKLGNHLDGKKSALNLLEENPSKKEGGSSSFDCSLFNKVDNIFETMGGKHKILEKIQNFLLFLWFPRRHPQYRDRFSERGDRRQCNRQHRPQVQRKIQGGIYQLQIRHHTTHVFRAFSSQKMRETKDWLNKYFCLHWFLINSFNQ